LMCKIFAPLEEAGRWGEDMLCVDSRIRHVYPILAAPMADFEEQSLLTCTYKTQCPTCVVLMGEPGELIHTQSHTRMQTQKALRHEHEGTCLHMRAWGCSQHCCFGPNYRLRMDIQAPCQICYISSIKVCSRTT
jgi:hypothetical protein